MLLGQCPGKPVEIVLLTSLSFGLGPDILEMTFGSPLKFMKRAMQSLLFMQKTQTHILTSVFRNSILLNSVYLMTDRVQTGLAQVGFFTTVICS